MKINLLYSLLVLVSLSLSSHGWAAGTTADATPAAAAATTAAATSSKEPKYTGEALVLKNKLNELFLKSQNVNAKGPKRAEARAAIENALDWDRIAKDCLPEGELKRAGAKNFAEFKGLLKDVIEKTAYSRLDSFWNNAQYHFTKIDLAKSPIEVKALFEVKDKDGTEEFSLDYYLVKRGKNWVIVDVAFEEVRYSENIREQIKTFLSESGFPNLLAKLRERRKGLVEAGS